MPGPTPPLLELWRHVPATERDSGAPRPRADPSGPRSRPGRAGRPPRHPARAARRTARRDGAGAGRGPRRRHWRAARRPGPAASAAPATPAPRRRGAVPVGAVPVDDRCSPTSASPPGRRRRRVGLVAVVVGSPWSACSRGHPGRPAPPAPAPDVVRTDNPAPVPWYANGDLHVRRAVVAVPGVTALVDVPDGGVYADDGRRRRAGQRRRGPHHRPHPPGDPVVGSEERGWVAWTDPERGLDLVVYDTRSTARPVGTSRRRTATPPTTVWCRSRSTRSSSTTATSAASGSGPPGTGGRGGHRGPAGRRRRRGRLSDVAPGRIRDAAALRRRDLGAGQRRPAVGGRQLPDHPRPPAARVRVYDVRGGSRLDTGLAARRSPSPRRSRRTATCSTCRAPAQRTGRPAGHAALDLAAAGAALRAGHRPLPAARTSRVPARRRSPRTATVRSSPADALPVAGAGHRTGPMPRFSFRQVDVFSTPPLRGNPVAVVHDADGLDDDQMAAFARWTNLSRDDLPAAAHRPGGRLPAADLHPRRASCRSPVTRPSARPTPGWRPGGVPAARRRRRAGVRRRAGRGAARRAARLRRAAAGALAARSPTRTSTGSPPPCGIGRDDVVDAAWVDNGPGWVGVLLRDAAAVLALEPDWARVRRPRRRRRRRAPRRERRRGRGAGVLPRARHHRGPRHRLAQRRRSASGWPAPALPASYVAAQGTALRRPGGSTWSRGAGGVGGRRHPHDGRRATVDL